MQPAPLGIVLKNRFLQQALSGPHAALGTPFYSSTALGSSCFHLLFKHKGWPVPALPSCSCTHKLAAPATEGILHPLRISESEFALIPWWRACTWKFKELSSTGQKPRMREFSASVFCIVTMLASIILTAIFHVFYHTINMLDTFMLKPRFCFHLDLFDSHILEDQERSQVIGFPSSML